MPSDSYVCAHPPKYLTQTAIQLITQAFKVTFLWNFIHSGNKVRKSILTLLRHLKRPMYRMFPEDDSGIIGVILGRFSAACQPLLNWVLRYLFSMYENL